MIDSSLIQGPSAADLVAQSLKELRKEGWRPKRIALCECCGTMQSVERRASMTSYYWDYTDSDAVDPNADWDGCDTCWLEHHEHWSGMWSDYYAGLL